MNEIKINIPFVKQKNEYFCGPASLQMVLNYHKIETEQEKLAKVMKTKEEIGTKKMEMVKVAERFGFHYCAKDNSKIEEIKDLLKNKIPVIVNFIEPTDEESHYAVVSGIDEKELILNDPWNGNNFRILKEEFLKRWYGFEDKRKRWILAVCDTPFGGCACSK